MFQQLQSQPGLTAVDAGQRGQYLNDPGLQSGSYTDPTNNLSRHQYYNELVYFRVEALQEKILTAILPTDRFSTLVST